MRDRTWVCVSRSSLVQAAYTDEVTGISPQSMTLAHELNGLALRGTL